ncbi:cysteine hydrolase family protein [Anaeromicropila herbilytica]|uniref:Isochorismatase n=1 Tax=Anaeromicropila herbilytica TaxID=2785025 RepID=A0A7R7EL87_9FIRM|nr:isochorismatase family cysteine hydrolase [Anaeromicropila herbilytica]BCN30852.1 isochorismatase [Anaeromicropila herbilytica]
MKALLVIDMQEDYIGDIRNKKRFPYKSDILLPRINQRISEFTKEGNLVIYIVNRFFYQRRGYKPELVKGLNIVEASPVFIKNRANSFSNPKLLQYLQEKNINEVELVGVDGNYCVAATALDAKKNGLVVKFNHQCIGVANITKFKKILTRLENDGITITD